MLTRIDKLHKKREIKWDKTHLRNENKLEEVLNITVNQ